MLDSIKINNFRNYKNFDLDNLSKVNLFTGKNNSGKSTLLEAIAIYTSGADLELIFNIIAGRNEICNHSNNISSANLKSISSLFFDRIIEFESKNAINISNNSDRLTLRFIKLTKYLAVSEDFNKFEYNNSRNEYNIQRGITVGLEIKFKHETIVYPLNQSYSSQLSPNNNKSYRNTYYISSNNLSFENNSYLFDRIALLEKEEIIIEALKLLEPRTERITFIDDDYNKRIAVIKLKNCNSIQPLQGMGNGINRILTIILAMVNADNGYLLIDEFENGLHYSVQTKLWEIIFNLAEKLNIQVFATTHSNDCIASFSEVLNKQNNTNEAKLIRLDNLNGTIHPVVYSANEIKIATEERIETR